MFNGQGNDLDAYQRRAAVQAPDASSHNRDDDPKGLDINAQICFFPDGTHVHRRRGHRPARPAPGLGHLQAAAARRSASSRPSRSASSSRRTRARPTTPRTTAAGSSPTGASSRPTSATRPAATATASSSSGSRRSRRASKTLKNGTNGHGAVLQARHRASRTAGGIAVDDDDNVYVASARPPTSGVLEVLRPVPDVGRRGRWVRRRPTSPARRWPTPCSKEQFIAAGEHGLVSPNAIVACRGDDSVVRVERVHRRHQRVRRRRRVRPHDPRSRRPARARARSRSAPARRSASASRPTAPSTSPTSAS